MANPAPGSAVAVEISAERPRPCVGREAPVGPLARARFQVWIGAVLVTLLHVVLKAPGIGHAGLWLDEAVSVHFAQLRPAQLLSAVQHDTNPPLYYLLLTGWERLFGISESAVRWPSVLASALTGGVLYVMAHREGGRFVAWCSSALFLASAAIFALRIKRGRTR